MKKDPAITNTRVTFLICPMAFDNSEMNVKMF